MDLYSGVWADKTLSGLQIVIILKCRKIISGWKDDPIEYVFRLAIQQFLHIVPSILINSKTDKGGPVLIVFITCRIKTPFASV